MTDRCPRCRRSVPGEAAFCPACGAAVAGDEVLIELEGAPGGAGDEVTFEPAGRRGRWVGAGVVAALVVAVGASIASGGGGSQTAATTTAADRPASTTSSPATTGPSTSPAPTTTAPVVVGDGGPLLGEATGLRVLVSTAFGLHRLDLDNGVVTAIEVDGARVYGTDVVAVPGGVVLSNGDGVRVADFVRGERPLATTGPAQLLGSDGQGGALLFVYGDGNAAGRVQRVSDASGATTEVELPWPPTAWPPVVADGRGGVLAPAPGGIYRLTPGADPVPLTTGALVDAGGGQMVTWRCFPDPACRLEVTDTLTGATRPGPPGAIGQWQAVRVSADGRWLVTDTWSPDIDDQSRPPGRRMRLLSLVDDRVVELPVTDSTSEFSPFQRSTLAWSPDGRWMFYVGGSHELAAWREGLAEPVRIDLADLLLSGALAVEPT